MDTERLKTLMIVRNKRKFKTIKFTEMLFKKRKR
jgi:hypothetical protein